VAPFRLRACTTRPGLLVLQVAKLTCGSPSSATNHPRLTRAASYIATAKLIRSRLCSRWLGRRGPRTGWRLRHTAKPAGSNTFRTVTQPLKGDEARVGGHLFCDAIPTIGRWDTRESPWQVVILALSPQLGNSLTARTRKCSPSHWPCRCTSKGRPFTRGPTPPAASQRVRIGRDA
jgi:hypothetical protein